jgi:hypothetical protein
MHRKYLKFNGRVKEDFDFLDCDTYKTVRCHNAEYYNVNPSACVRHTLYINHTSQMSFI